MSKKVTIEEIKKIALQRNGKCLSSRYITAKTKLQWQCEKGHQWESTPDSVKHGTWCPHCGGSLKLTIEEARNLATLRHGQCISDKYTNARTKLKWKCSDGHQWEATVDNIKHGSWCPY